MEGLLITAALISAPILINKALVWSDEWWKRTRPADPALSAQGASPRPHSGHPQQMPSGPNNPTAPPAKQPLTPMLKFILCCVVLHTLYIIAELALNRPTNMFTALQMPLTIPVSQLRAKVQGFADPNPLPPHLEFLLNKFNSFDTRGYYVRFGHEAIASCIHCTTQSDYLIFYLAHVSLEYVRMAALLAVMTIRGSGKRKWRQWALASTIGCWGTELWKVATVDVVVSRKLDEVTMWHERIWYLRHAYFLITPLVLYALPYAYVPVSPLRALPVLSMQIDFLATRLNLLSHLRTSIARSDVLREQGNKYWKAEAEEAKLGRTDITVVNESERLGMGYADIPGRMEGQEGNPEGSSAQNAAVNGASTDGHLPSPYRLRAQVRQNIQTTLDALQSFEQQAAQVVR